MYAQLPDICNSVYLLKQMWSLCLANLSVFIFHEFAQTPSELEHPQSSVLSLHLCDKVYHCTALLLLGTGEFCPKRMFKSCF